MTVKEDMDAVGRELFVVGLLGLDAWLWYIDQQAAAMAVLTILSGSVTLYFFDKSG